MAALRSTLWRLRHGRGKGAIVSTSYGPELGSETSVDLHVIHAIAEKPAHGRTGVPGGIEPEVLRARLVEVQAGGQRTAATAAGERGIRRGRPAAGSGWRRA